VHGGKLGAAKGVNVRLVVVDQALAEVVVLNLDTASAARLGDALLGSEVASGAKYRLARNRENGA